MTVKLKLILMGGLVLGLSVLGLVLSGKVSFGSGVSLKWREIGSGRWELTVDGGKRKVTAVDLKGSGEVVSIETEGRGGLVNETEKEIGGGEWKWGAVVLGPVEQVGGGGQVWARFETGVGKVKAFGVVVLAKDGNGGAEEVEVEGGI